MNWIKSSWSAINDYLEYGDLVPFLVLVSAVHYAVILAGKDYWLVAVAIGLLVDLGHFRTIRAAFRYTGDDRRQQFARWLIALVMTGISLTYHQRYYNDFWLSAPIPFLIAALAWLQKVDRRSGSKSETTTKPTETKKETKAQPTQPEGNRERVLALHLAQPDATHETIAKQVGISRQLVGRYIKENGVNR